VDYTPEAKSAGLPSRVLAGLRDRGVLTRNLASGALQVSPPFVIEDTDIAVLAAAISESLADAGATRPALPPSGLLPDTTRDEGIESYDDRHYLEQRPPHHG